MNKILIDTSILISHLNGRQATTDFLRTLAHSDSPLPAISVIGEMELYTLSQASPELISKILATVEVIPLSSTIAQRAGVFKSNFPEMTTEHAIVAATAQEYGFTLVTMDLKAYKIIPGLIVFNIPNE